MNNTTDAATASSTAPSTLSLLLMDNLETSV
jgi:hypothetical protein